MGFMAKIELQRGKRVIGDQRDKLAGVLRKRYESGENIRSLAAEAGRSYGFVHRVLVESGTTMRGRGGSTRGPKAAKG
jgi:hypothetical protein